jgi:glycosyltransferase involved in cell wall biosynthesis
VIVQRGGAERVLDAMAEAFPDAPIYALLYSRKNGPAHLEKRIRPSWLNRVPGAPERHRGFLPFYRNAIESFDLRDYDVIVSSHHSVGKGIVRRSDQIQVCYCHTTMRALWERPDEELATLWPIVRWVVRPLLSHLRVWDVTTANRVDQFIANSRTTQLRIWRQYRRESIIIYPPVDTERFTPGGPADDYYLVASRAVPYKRLDVAIAAAQLAGRRLLLVGQRPRTLPRSPLVQFLGEVSDPQLVSLMRGARALLFPQHEDFGIAALEMNAVGRPVIAFAAGGALETVIDGVTGILVPEQTPEAFAAGIARFEAMTFDPAVIRRHAERFGRARFIAELRAAVDAARREPTFAAPAAALPAAVDAGPAELRATVDAAGRVMPFAAPALDVTHLNGIHI